jgi:hypothetical protein
MNPTGKPHRAFSDQMLYAVCFIELIHPIMDHKGDPT